MNITDLIQKLKSIPVGYKKREYGYTCTKHVVAELSQHEYNYAINKNLITVSEINRDILKINI